MAYGVRPWNLPAMSSGQTSCRAETIAAATASVVRALADLDASLIFETISAMCVGFGLHGGSGTRARRLDGGYRVLGLVRLGIVADHHVAGPQLRDHRTLHIVLERPGLGGTLNQTIAAVTPDRRNPQVSVIVSQ